MKNLSFRRQHKLKRNIQDNHSVSFSVSSSVSVRSTIHVYCVKFISLMTMHTKCFFFQTSCHLKEHIYKLIQTSQLIPISHQIQLKINISGEHLLLNRGFNRQLLCAFFFLCILISS